MSDHDNHLESASAEASCAPTPSSGHREGGPTKRQIFIGGLSFDSEERDLRDFFHDCGEIESIRIPSHHDTGRPRGIAFVDFVDNKGAERALEKDGQDLQGRSLKISPTKTARGDAAAGYRNRDRSPPPSRRSNDCKTVFVGNLSHDAEERDLSKAFEGCGDIESIRIVLDRDTGKARGFGYVEFTSKDAVESALKISGQDIAGRIVRVDYAADRDAAPRGRSNYDDYDRRGGRDDRRGGGRDSYRDRDYHDRDSYYSERDHRSGRDGYGRDRDAGSGRSRRDAYGRD
jgi:nucleolin